MGEATPCTYTRFQVATGNPRSDACFSFQYVFKDKSADPGTNRATADTQLRGQGYLVRDKRALLVFWLTNQFRGKHGQLRQFGGHAIGQRHFTPRRYGRHGRAWRGQLRSEEHTSELQARQKL